MGCECHTFTPRWHFARCLSSARDDSGAFPKGGVARGLLRFSEDSDRILRGEDVLDNSILCKKKIYVSDVRIHVWRAILRSALYIHERNAPYNTPTWRVIRGIDPPSRLKSAFMRENCCAVGGLGAARLSLTISHSVLG